MKEREREKRASIQMDKKNLQNCRCERQTRWMGACDLCPGNMRTRCKLYILILYFLPLYAM